MSAVGVMKFLHAIRKLLKLRTITQLVAKYELRIIYVVTDVDNFKEEDRKANPEEQEVPGFGKVEDVKESDVNVLEQVKFFITGIELGTPQTMFATVKETVENKAENP